MRRVAYLHCGGCFTETLFVLYAPEESGAWDEHMSQCRECGYRFGYIDVEPRTVVDGDGNAITTYEGRPVLDDKVLRDGMAKLQRETAERLKSIHGPHVRAKGAAKQRFRLAQRDASQRARLLNSGAPGLAKR